MKHRFVDIHHHLAYGVDDGPKNLEQMQQMLRRAADEGIGCIVATPHATPGVHRFPIDEYQKALAEARAYCIAEGLEIEILEGCEVFYTDQAPRLLGEYKLPTLAKTDFVLVEFSPDIRFSKLRDALERLIREGFRPVIAHAERYDCLINWPSRAERLKAELDVRLQINCSSIIRKRGLRVRYFIKRMMEKELIDALGTDAHNITSRAANMNEAYKIVNAKYGERYAKQLTDGGFLAE